MQTTIGIARRAARAISLLLAGGLAAGCGGAHGLVPATPGAGEPAASRSAGAGAYRPQRGTVAIRLRVRIPRRTHQHERPLHPSTISALTESVGIGINGKPALYFDATPTSPGCAIGPTGTVCTFTLNAPFGTDTFAVTTYSGLAGSGTALDEGTATIPIARGKANDVPVTLGPVVSTTADSGVGSLRYAIETANKGDTIMFLLPAGSTIVLASAITITGTVTLAGPGASALSISGASEYQIFSISGNATISGLTLTDGGANLSSDPGGAIENGGSLTLANDVIGNSYSTVAIVRGKKHLVPNRMRAHCAATYRYAGALYNSGNLVSSGTTYSGNAVASDVGSCVYGYGGAIYNFETGTIVSTDDTFSNNAAYEGGAIYNASYGVTTFTNDTFTGNRGCTAATGCPTTGCTPGSACTSNATGTGGAIFDDGIGVTIVDSTFTNNVVGGATTGSTGMGGAIALSSLFPRITGSTFSYNVAGGGTGSSCGSGLGGAIFMSGGSLTIENDAFAHNVASGDDGGEGGAVIASGPTVDAENDTFTSNQANGYGSACNTSAEGVGGAIVAASGLANFANDTFTANLATANAMAGGGAIYGAELTLANDSFASNAAVATSTQGAIGGAEGGAVVAAGAGKVSGTVFNLNQTVVEGTSGGVAYGGAVFGGGIFTSSGNLFISNSSSALNAPSATVAAGAVVIAGGTCFSSNDTFKYDTAKGAAMTEGGAALFGGSFFMNGDTFTANSVTGVSALGGALSIATGSGTMTNSAFTSNSANATSTSIAGAGGGAIYDDGGITYQGVTITGNSATSAGGGVAAGMPEEYEASTISGNAVSYANTPTAGGGGIFGLDSLFISDSTIANNSLHLSASADGGGAGIMDAGGLDLLYSTISGNAMSGGGPSSGGGGVYDHGGSDAFVSTISGNTTTTNGGGYYVAATNTIALSNVTMYQNSATGTGGNIDNPYTMTLTNTVVGGGTAATGPDIDNTGTLTSGDYNIIGTAVVGTAMTGTTTHNKTTNPLLLGLANNGGPTFTNADQATSPGTNYIPYSGGLCNSTSLIMDQRGYNVGANGHCDAGAFDLDGAVPTIRHHVTPRKMRQHHGRSVAWLHPIVLRPLHFKVQVREI